MVLYKLIGLNRCPYRRECKQRLNDDFPHLMEPMCFTGDHQKCLTYSEKEEVSSVDTIVAKATHLRLLD